MKCCELPDLSLHVRADARATKERAPPPRPTVPKQGTLAPSTAAPTRQARREVTHSNTFWSSSNKGRATTKWHTARMLWGKLDHGRSWRRRLFRTVHARGAIPGRSLPHPLQPSHWRSKIKNWRSRCVSSKSSCQKRRRWPRHLVNDFRTERAAHQVRERWEMEGEVERERGR